MLESATPVLRVAEYTRARAFYQNALGFACVEEGGDPPRFGIFLRDRARLFVDSWAGPDATQGGWRAYVHVEDLDALAGELSARLPLSRAITETAYGMREFEVTDPDGNVICFGADA